MANAEIGNLHGVASADLTQKFDAGTTTDSIAAMRTRLTAISATNYTAARLDTLSANDMLYAIRVNDFLTTIKQ